MKEQDFLIFYDVTASQLGDELRSLRDRGWFIQRIIRVSRIYQPDMDMPCADYMVVISENERR